jgi:hypothetical protein
MSNTPKRGMSIFQKIRRHTTSIAISLKIENEPELAVNDTEPNLFNSPLPDEKRQSLTHRTSVASLTQSTSDLFFAPINPGTIMRFQNRFPDVPTSLLEYHSCAWERDILWQGRMYITTSAICFYAKIFGNEVKKSIDFNEITEIEKAYTVGLFPNAIRVHTKNQRYFFTSFLKRDVVYDQLKDLWMNSNGGSETQDTSAISLDKNLKM